MEAKLTSKISSEGEFVIPLTVREALGIEAGDWVEFVEFAPGRYELRVPKRSIRELKGILKSDAPPLSIEELNGIIVE